MTFGRYSPFGQEYSTLNRMVVPHLFQHTLDDGDPHYDQPEPVDPHGQFAVLDHEFDLD